MKFVALDLETTGLYHEKDEIIELAVVVFDMEKNFDEWSTVVHTDREVPEFILSFTNITREEIQQGMHISDVLSYLQKYFEDVDFLVGHNIEFDISFLKTAGFIVPIPSIDTYSLATMLLKGEPSYSLTNLTRKYELGTDTRDHHRALTDTQASVNLFRYLFSKMQQIPTQKLETLVQRIKPYSWEGVVLFEEALKTSKIIAADDGTQQSFQFNIPASKEKYDNLVIVPAYVEPYDRFNMHPSYALVCHRDVTIAFDKPANEYLERLAIQYYLREEPSFMKELNTELKGITSSKILQADALTCSRDDCPHHERCEFYKQEAQDTLQGLTTRYSAYEFFENNKHTSQTCVWKEAETLPDSMFYANIIKLPLETWEAATDKIKIYCADSTSITQFINQITIFYARLGMYVRSQTELDFLWFSKPVSLPYELNETIGTLTSLHEEIEKQLQTQYEIKFTNKIIARLSSLMQQLSALMQQTSDADVFCDIYNDRITLGFVVSKEPVPSEVTNQYEVSIPLQNNERKYLESALPQGTFLASTDRVEATVFVPNTIASYNDTQSFYPAILRVIKTIFKEKNSAVLMVTGQKVIEEVFALSKKLLGNDVEVMAIPINTKFTMAKQLFESQTKKKLLLTTVYMGFPQGIQTDALLISRLPFEVMNTPWYNYRTRNLENSFLEYALPRAVIKFLRWIVACPSETEFWCFDKRIHTQKYAREFTKYLGGIDIQNI